MKSRSHSRAWRAFSLAVALLLSLGMLPGLLTSRHAFAADNPTITQSEFEDLVDEATADDPVYGPEEGDLDLDPEKVTFSTADTDEADFYAEATFQNPYAASTQQFDYGIQFRSGDEDFLRFIVVSDGTWGITEGTKDVLVSGTYDNLDDTKGGENKLSVYADGDTIHVAIDGDYVGSATSDVTSSGHISVGTSFLPDSLVEGKTTGFTDFSIWELGGGGLGPTSKAPTKTDSNQDETPTKTDSNQDETPTPDANDLEGTTYESQTFGYTVTYDDSWEVTKDETQAGSDDFRISNGTSSMQFLGTEYDGSPDDCIQDAIDALNQNPDMDNVDVAVDNDNNELQGDLDDGSAYAVVNLTYQDSDLTAYYQCTPIEEGTSMIKVTQIAAADDYNDQIDARSTVLDTLSPDGSIRAGGNNDSGDDTTPSNDDVTPSDDNGTPSDELPAGSVVVYLEATTSDGPVVLASLIPQDNQTEVQLFVLAADSGSAYDASFNEGTCTKPGDVAIDIGTTDSDGLLDETVDGSVDDLSNGDYVMVLTDESGDVVACGDPSEFTSQ